MASQKTPWFLAELAPHLLKPMSQSQFGCTGGRGGRLGGTLGGKPICLLTTTGRKSGRQRTQALLYVADGEDILLVAAQGGLPTNPMWLLNLRADPRVRIQVGSRVLDIGRVKPPTRSGPAGGPGSPRTIRGGRSISRGPTE